jgi:hypothetical protein
MASTLKLFSLVHYQGFASAVRGVELRRGPTVGINV